MKFRLVEDWQAVLRRAWSVKFNILAALFAAAEVALQILQTALEPQQLIPAGSFAILAGFASGGAVIARVLAQQELSGKSE